MLFPNQRKQELSFISLPLKGLSSPLQTRLTSTVIFLLQVSPCSEIRRPASQERAFFIVVS